MLFWLIKLEYYSNRTKNDVFSILYGIKLHFYMQNAQAFHKTKKTWAINKTERPKIIRIFSAALTEACLIFQIR